jgi:hypothetical protein
MASLVGVLVGLVMVVACCVALFWNEGRAVAVARALTEGAGLATATPATRVDPALENRLVHITGPARGALLEDRDLGVATTALRLEREVEMYQWRESRSTETRNGERVTVYRYTREWSSRPINSSDFRQPLNHQNPPMPIASRTLNATAQLEAYTLTPDVIGRVPSSAAQTMPVPDTAIVAADARFGGRARIVDGAIYVGTPDEPRVGDLRIRYRQIPDGTLSFVGRQSGAGLVPYRASNGQEFLLARAGAHGAAAMFDMAQHDNVVLTWVIRAVALVFMWVGFALVFRPFVALAEWIPIVGSIVEAGAMAIALVLTLLVGLPVMAVAWFAARPLLAGALIAGAIAAVFGLKALADRRHARRVAAAPQGFAGPRGSAVPFIPPHVLPPSGGTRT